MTYKDQGWEKDVLIVGVTGRRHIVKESLDAVEKATREALRAICAAIPAGTRVLLASGLAVGADSIAARACVELGAADETLPMRLLAVLPMSREKYRDDFKGDELQGFETLLASAKEIVELPEAQDFDRIAQDFDRIAQYSKLRDYLVERADILLAFWSGDESEVKPGGTVDVVLSKRRVFQQEGRGAILSIATPELKRVREKDGTKRYEPEEGVDAGRIVLERFGREESTLRLEKFLKDR